MFASIRTRDGNSSFCLSLCPASVLIALLVIEFAMVKAKAADYIAPDQSIELFQLEKIPLQLHSMSEISRHLLVLALRNHDASPASQRATGKIILLAMQLDPGNSKAVEANKAFDSGQKQPPSPDASINHAKAQLESSRKLLGRPQAGPEANKLAKLISDAISASQPQTAGSKELADWRNCLPPLTAYAAPPPAQALTPVKPTAPNPGGDKTIPVSEEAKAASTPVKANAMFHLIKQTVRTPFSLLKPYQGPQNPADDGFDQEFIIRNEIAPVHLELTTENQDKTKKDFSISLRGNNEPRKSQQQDLNDTLMTCFSKRHEKLPHCLGRVLVPDGHYDENNHLNLTGPMALMLEGSLTNQPLRKDLHVLAAINQQGALVQPANFWQMLSVLRQSASGGRLIIPRESETLTQQLLVFGEPDFFTRWEVLSANDISEAMLAATAQGSTRHARAGELFDSIRQLAGRRSTTQLAVDYGIRERLGNILKLEPRHVSATSLLLQGSGKRPMHLNEQALALELLPVVVVLGKTLSSHSNPQQLDNDLLGSTHTSARAQLDAMAILVDRSDDGFYQEALELANGLRDLARLNKRNETPKATEYSEQKAITMHEDMSKQSADLILRMTNAAGLDNARDARQ